MENRLLRNEHDKVIAGVSSGLAAYMEVDVTIIRLLFVLSTIFLVGTGVLVYLVMWIVVPVNNDPAAKFSKFNDYFKQQPPSAGFNAPPFGQPNPFANEGASETKTSSAAGQAWQTPGDFKLPKNNGTGRTVGGLFLLVIGLYFLMNEFDIIPYWFRLGKLWPLVFVAIGLSFILKSKRKNSWEEWKREQEEAMEKPEAKTGYTEQTTTYTEAKPADFSEKKPVDFSGDLPKDEPKDQL